MKPVKLIVYLLVLLGVGAYIYFYEIKHRQAESAKEEEKQKMLKLLLDSGMDLTMAKAAVEAGAKAKLKAAAEPKNSYDRVTVEYNGKQYDMPVKGNMGNELKAILAESKLDRDDFIKAYKVEAETENAGE